MYETLEHEGFLEAEDEDFLEAEHEHFLEAEHEGFLEAEDEDFLEAEHEHFLEAEHEGFLEAEDEDFLEAEHEHFLEAEHEDFLGSLVSSVLGSEVAGPLHEQEELELASELLEVQSEDELEEFLGKLVKRAARGVSNFARSSTGRALGGILKNVAKRALPVVGGALGSMVAPGIGTALGSKLGSMAGNLFEMEGEISHEELEFEMARRVVRIGATAANRAARSAPTAPPARIARRAVVQAARVHAPATLRPVPRGGVYPRYRVRRPAGGYRATSARFPAARTTGRRVPAARWPVGRTTAAPASPRSAGRPRGGVRPAYGRRRAGYVRAASQPGTSGVSYRPGRTGTWTGSRPSGGWGGYYPGDPDATWSDGSAGTGGTWTDAPGTGRGWADGSAALSGRWVRRGDRIIVIGA